MNININKNETSRHLGLKKINIDINKSKHKFNNKYNAYKSHIFKNFFCFKKIKIIILLLISLLTIFGIVIFLILYFSNKKEKKTVKVQQDISQINLDGKYIPKDRLNFQDIKNCSIKNCKKCYGNSYNDTCISCFASFTPIRNKNNKIISCEYNPDKTDNKTILDENSDESNLNDDISTTDFDKKVDTTYIPNSMSDSANPEFNKSDNISEKTTNLIIDNKTDNIYEITTNLITDNTTYNISETTTKLSTDDISGIITETTKETEIIINCRSGYYYPLYNNTNHKCKKCSVSNCKICHENDTKDYCDSCMYNYFPIYNENNIISCKACESNCKECEHVNFTCIICKNEYILKDGKCYNYSFVANYSTVTENQTINLINMNIIFISEIIYEGKNINETKFLFEQAGYHEVYFILKDNMTSFANIFYNNTNLIEIKFNSKYQFSNIISLHNMFGHCSSLKSVKFSNLYIPLALDLSKMFSDCHNLTYIFFGSYIQTIKVENMYGMFLNCYSLTSLNLNFFVIDNVEALSFMFSNCSSLNNIILPEMESSKIILMNNMFSGCSKLSSIDLSYFDVSSVKNMSSMFSGCYSLRSIEIPDYIHYFKKPKIMIINGIEVFLPGIYVPFYTNNIAYIDHMFENCTSLKYANFSNFNFASIINMDHMFSNCISLTSIIFNNNRDKIAEEVRNISYIFYNCKSLESINLSIFRNSYNLKDISHMFENCLGLTAINLSYLYAENIENIQFMFSGCRALISLEFNFNNNYIKYMNSLFSGCSSLKSINLNNINTKNVIDMSRMFYNCSSLKYLNLNSFYTPKLKFIDEMFFGCETLAQLDINNFNITSLESYNDLLKNVNTTLLINTNQQFAELLIQILYSN